MDVFPAICVVESDGGQGIGHVEGLEEGGRENPQLRVTFGY